MRSKVINSILALALVALIYLGIILHPAVKQNVLGGSFDFVIFYTGGHIVKEGMSKRLYSYETQSNFQQGLTHRSGLLPFNHPPFEALLFVPLAFFSYLWAYRIWALINFVLVGLSAYVLGSYLGKVQSLLLRLVFVLSAFIPLFVGIVQGQDSILMLFLYALVFVSLKQDRPWRAGCLLALALLKFQLVVPFVLVFFVKRRWKVVWGFVATAALLGVVSLGLIGWSGVGDWVRLVRRENANLPNAGIPDQTIFPPAMPNLRGLLDVVLGARVPAPVLGLAIGICSVILILWCISRWGSGDAGDEEAFDLLFALTVMVTLLVSYHLYLHDLVLVGLPILIGLSRFETSAKSWRRHVFAGSALLLFVVALLLIDRGSRQFWILSGLVLSLAFTISAELTNARRATA